MLHCRTLPQILLVLSTSAVALGCASSKTKLPTAKAPPTVAQSNTPPLLTILVDGGYLLEEPRQPLVLVVWDDGRIVWSGDQIRGGPPLFMAILSKEKRDLLVSDLEKIAVKAKALPRAGWSGPDAKFTTIRYQKLSDDIKLWSWHEISEAQPTLVASSLGIESLHGRKREDVLAASTEPYRQFRSVWQEIRNAIQRILPVSGDGVNPSTSTAVLANSISAEEAGTKARHALDEKESGWVVGAGIRVRGAWMFPAYSPSDHVASGHFVVLVLDDGTVELKRGL